MLRLARDLKGYKLSARDGDIGKAEEFYFDDRSWAVRYLIADTGGWLGGRQVLISPYALDPARKDDQVIPVAASHCKQRLIQTNQATHPEAADKLEDRTGGTRGNDRPGLAPSSAGTT